MAFVWIAPRVKPREFSAPVDAERRWQIAEKVAEARAVGHRDVGHHPVPQVDVHAIPREGVDHTTLVVRLEDRWAMWGVPWVRVRVGVSTTPTLVLKISLPNVGT